MQIKYYIIPFIFLFLGVFPSDLYTQDEHFAVLEGIVTDRKTDQPLENVNVVISGTTLGTSTNEEGYFKLIYVPVGEQTIIFSYVGFATYRLTQNFSGGNEYAHDVEMYSRAIDMPELEIVEERYPDYDRRRAPDSHLITGEQIRESGIQSFGDLIRRFVPRAEVSVDGHDLNIRLTRESSITQRYFGAENPLIILNGINIGNTPGNLNAMIHPQNIERMEVIRGPSALSYGRGGEHGVIFIDTETPQYEGDIEWRSIIFGLSVISYALYILLLW